MKSKIVSHKTQSILNKRDELSRQLTNLFKNINGKTHSIPHEIICNKNTALSLDEFQPPWFIKESREKSVPKNPSTDITTSTRVRANNTTELFKLIELLGNESQSECNTTERNYKKSNSIDSDITSNKKHSGNCSIKIEKYNDSCIHEDVSRTDDNMVESNIDEEFHPLDTVQKFKDKKHMKSQKCLSNVLDSIPSKVDDQRHVLTNVKSQAHKTCKSLWKKQMRLNSKINSAQNGKDLSLIRVKKPNQRWHDIDNTESDADDGIKDDNQYHLEESTDEEREVESENKRKSSEKKQSTQHSSSQNCKDYRKLGQIIGEQHRNTQDKERGTRKEGKNVAGCSEIKTNSKNILPENSFKCLNSHQLQSPRESSLSRFPADIKETPKNVFVIFPCDKILKQDFQMFKIPVPDESIQMPKNPNHKKFPLTSRNHFNGRYLNSVVSQNAISNHTEHDQPLNEVLSHLLKGLQVSDRHTKLSVNSNGKHTPSKYIPSNNLEFQLMEDILKQLTEVVHKLDSISEQRQDAHLATRNTTVETNDKCKYCEMEKTAFVDEKKIKKLEGDIGNGQFSEERDKDMVDVRNQKYNKSTKMMQNDICLECEKINNKPLSVKEVPHGKWGTETLDKMVLARPSTRKIKQSSNIHDRRERMEECAEIMKMLERVLESENNKKKDYQQNRPTTRNTERFQEQESREKEKKYDDCYDALVLLESYLNARKVELNRLRSKESSEKHKVKKLRKIKQQVGKRTTSAYYRLRPVSKVNNKQSLEAIMKGVSKTKKELRKDNGKYLNYMLSKNIDGANFIEKVIFPSNPNASKPDQNKGTTPEQESKNIKTYREKMNSNTIEIFPNSTRSFEIESSKSSTMGENPSHVRTKMNLKSPETLLGIKFACERQCSKGKDRPSAIYNDTCDRKYDTEVENQRNLYENQNSNKPRTPHYCQTKTNHKRPIKSFKEIDITHNDIDDSVENDDSSEALIGMETDEKRIRGQKEDAVPVRIAQPVVYYGSKLNCCSRKRLPTCKQSTLKTHINCAKKIKCENHHLSKPNRINTVYPEELSTGARHRELCYKTQQPQWLQEPVNQYLNQTRSFVDKIAPSFQGVENKTLLKWISRVPVRNVTSKASTEHELMKYNGLYYYPSDYYVYEYMDDAEDTTKQSKDKNLKIIGRKKDQEHLRLMSSTMDDKKIMLNFTKILHIYSPQKDISSNEAKESSVLKFVKSDKLMTYNKRPLMRKVEDNSKKPIENGRLNVPGVRMNKIKTYSSLSNPEETTPFLMKEISFKSIPPEFFKEQTWGESCNPARFHKYSKNKQEQLELTKKPFDMSDFLVDDFLRKPERSKTNHVGSWIKQNFDFECREPLEIKKCDISDDISEFHSDDCFLRKPNFKRKYLTQNWEIADKSIDTVKCCHKPAETIKKIINAFSLKKKSMLKDNTNMNCVPPNNDKTLKQKNSWESKKTIKIKTGKGNTNLEGMKKPTGARHRHKKNREKSDMKINIFNITFNKLSESTHTKLQEPRQSETRNLFDLTFPAPQLTDKKLNRQMKRINNKLSTIYHDTSRQITEKPRSQTKIKEVCESPKLDPNSQIPSINSLNATQPSYLEQTQFTSPGQTEFTNKSRLTLTKCSQAESTTYFQQTRFINRLPTPTAHTVDSERLKRLLDRLKDEFYKYNVKDTSKENLEVTFPVHKKEKLFHANNEKTGIGTVLTLSKTPKLSRAVLNKLLREIHKTLNTETITIKNLI